MTQKLSPSAAKAKAARDLRYAKSPVRKRMKAENQRKRGTQLGRQVSFAFNMRKK